MMAGRTLVSKLSPLIAATRCPSLLRLRPLLAAGDGVLRRSFTTSVSGGLRSFSTRPTTSSLNDPSPNWSNRPPKETILLDGCDFEHWLVVMEPPEPNTLRDAIIDSYIKTLAQVVGSEEEARMKIYSVSTKHYFAFGALVSEELSYKIKALPKVRWVLPDSYLDVRNKDYGGEPFINGEAVPYDPKYHEEWVRNNNRANERSRRNDRPRNFDRSRNFERRRENMQNRDAPPMQNQGFQSSPTAPPPQNAAPPMQNQGFQSSPTPPPPQNAAPPMPNRDFNSNVPPPQPPPHVGYQNQIPNPSYQGSSQGYQGQGGAPGYQGGSPGYQGGNPGFQGGNPSYQGGNPGFQGGNPSYQGGNPGYQAGSPGYQGGNTGYQGGGPGYQSGAGVAYQGGNNNQAGNSGYQGYQGGNTTNYQGGGPGFQGRDVPGRD